MFATRYVIKQLIFFVLCTECTDIIRIRMLLPEINIEVSCTHVFVVGGIKRSPQCSTDHASAVYSLVRVPTTSMQQCFCILHYTWYNDGNVQSTITVIILVIN